MHDDNLFARLARVDDVLLDYTTQEKVAFLLMAWLVWAANARNDQLGVPGGFSAEQERQLHQLQKAADLIRQAAPDLEGERLFQEGDMDGWLQHVRRQVQAAHGPESSDAERGVDDRS